VKTPEFYEKKDISDFLDSLAPDCWYFKPLMAGYGKAGVSDIVGCYKGTMFTVEVKREGRSPTPIQEGRMSEVGKARGWPFWGTASKVIPELKQAFGV
jgi:hypothetical protein